jgi:hypothetical protein
LQSVEDGGEAGAVATVGRPRHPTLEPLEPPHAHRIVDIRLDPRLEL